MELVIKAKNYAEKVHNDAGCTYGEHDESYVVHLDAVRDWILKFPSVLRFDDDYANTLAAAYTHDVIEDAQQTYNDVKDKTTKEVADITLAVTDIQAETRMLRFLLTVPKIVRDHRALVLKVCDIGANAGYGSGVKNSMYRKYQKEWAAYKRGIFIAASKQYEKEINLDRFDELIEEVDKTMGYWGLYDR